MSVGDIVPAFLALAAILVAGKNISDYIKAQKEKHIESLGSTANKKMLAELKQLKDEFEDMKIKQSHMDGVIDAMFKMSKRE